MSLFLGIVEQVTSVSGMNTFIGGKASTLSTPALLAQKLAINESSISDFLIIGDNIEARIDDNYSLPGLIFFNDNEIKHFICTEGRCNYSYHDIFRGSSIELAVFTGTAVAGPSFFRNCTKLKTAYIYGQRVRVGSTLGFNSVFNGTSGVKIYCHPDIQTCNAGAPDGDITDATTNRGASVVYVQNRSAPVAISDLSIGNVFGTSLQVLFTAPTGSVNAIDFYEIWVNGVFNRVIAGSGGYATNLSLSTFYSIEVKPVDIYYNKSSSNISEQSTSNALVYQDALVSYYKMENNVLDSIGTNNGTATAITYAAGLVGQSAIFNGTNSGVNIGDKNEFTFADASVDKPFSLSCLFKWNGSKVNNELIGKRDISTREYTLNYSGGVIQGRTYSDGTYASYKQIEYAVNLGTDWHSIMLTYDGTLIRLYLDGNAVGGTSTVIGSAYNRMSNTAIPVTVGTFHQYAEYTSNGNVDEVVIWNKCLTASEALEVDTKLKSGQSLI